MCLYFSNKDKTFVLEQYGEITGRTRSSGHKQGLRLCLCDCTLQAILRVSELLWISVLANIFGTGVPKHCLLHALAMILGYAKPHGCSCSYPNDMCTACKIPVRSRKC